MKNKTIDLEKIEIGDVVRNAITEDCYVVEDIMEDGTAIAVRTVQITDREIWTKEPRSRKTPCKQEDEVLNEVFDLALHICRAMYVDELPAMDELDKMAEKREYGWNHPHTVAARIARLLENKVLCR